MKWIDLTPILSPIEWAVIGAVATRHYMPERLTRDLDLIIMQNDGLVARQKLISAGYKFQSDLGIGGSAWSSPRDEQIDLIEGDQPWLEDALHQAQSNRDLQGLPILPLPYLVLLKFQSGRVQDLADLTRMFGLSDEAALNRVRKLIQQYEPEGYKDLESMITLGKMELGRA